MAPPKNIRPNWGLGRNLQIQIFDEIDHVTMMTSVNKWLASLGKEKILGMVPLVDTFQSPKAEIFHVFILYSVE